MAYILPWVYIVSARSVWQRRSGWLLAGLGMAASMWVAWHADALGDQYGALEGGFQLALALVLLLVGSWDTQHRSWENWEQEPMLL